ncbi:MAG: choice-of-anchor Q domain-containing protein, partial [Acidimicrobiales bacterium]
AGGASLYAAATGGATSGPCTSVATACTLEEALLLVTPGGTIFLTTPGTTVHYKGNWNVNTPNTTPATPITIEPEPGVIDPVLSGNQGGSANCTTSSCAGAILLLTNHASLTLEDLIVINANDMFSAAQFAGDGGAIDMGDGGTGGTLVASGVTFSSNSAGVGGGAIEAGTNGGSATVIVTGSTFISNTSPAGGAIGVGENGGSGSLTVSDSTFTSNSSADLGGAINVNSEVTGAQLTAAITDSTFASNQAAAGGAIDSGDLSGGTVTITASTFLDNMAINNALQLGDGGAILSAGNQGTSAVSVTDSTFSGNTAYRNGPTIDGGESASGGSVAVAADIFNGSCDQVSGMWHDGGYNVATDSSCFAQGVATDTDAGSTLSSQLGSLASNGGPTQTIEPLSGNPAIGDVPNPTSESLNSSTVMLCPTTDQRGVSSPPAPTKCNAGAVQKDPTAPLPPTLTSATPGNGTIALMWSAPSFDGGLPLTGYDAYCSAADPPPTTTPSATAGPTTTTVTVSGLTNGTPYFCAITASNTAATFPATGPSALSNVLSATPNAKVASKLTLSLVPPTSPGGALGVTATVAPANPNPSSPIPTGTVRFTITGVTCAGGSNTVTLVAGSATCTFTTSSAFQARVSYSGDSNYITSSATAEMGQPNFSAPVAIWVGSAGVWTLTSQLYAAGFGAKGGTVTFEAGAIALCSATTDPSGDAECQVTPSATVTAGTIFDATFGGDTLLLPATSPRGTLPTT